MFPSAPRRRMRRPHAHRRVAGQRGRIAARRRKQHAGRVRSPIRYLGYRRTPTATPMAIWRRIGVLSIDTSIRFRRSSGLPRKRRAEYEGAICQLVSQVKEGRSTNVSSHEYYRSTTRRLHARPIGHTVDSHHRWPRFCGHRREHSAAGSPRCNRSRTMAGRTLRPSRRGPHSSRS